MLSGVPARACPAAVPHGGILVPLSAYSVAPTSQPCGAPRAGRNRPASELALQITGSRISQQPGHRNISTRQLRIAWAHERQPGPHEDGCGCHEPCSAGTQHQYQQHPQPPTPRQSGVSSSSSSSTAGDSGAARAPGPLVTGAGDPSSSTAAARTSPDAAGGPVSSGDSGGRSREVSNSTGSGPSTSIPPTSPLDPASTPDSATTVPGPPATAANSSTGLIAANPAALPSPHSLQQPQAKLSDTNSNSSSSSSSDSQPDPEALLKTTTNNNSADGDGGGGFADGSPPGNTSSEGSDGFHLDLDLGANASTGPNPGLAVSPSDLAGPLGPLGFPPPIQPPGVGSGAGAASGGPQQLPPLRLDFLDWAKLQQKGTGGGGGVGPIRRRRSGSSMLSSSESAAAGGSRSRSDRILQLVLAAKTLLQVRSVVSRHLHGMSPSTAAVALSRLAALSVATMRLRRAQQGLGVQQQSGRKGKDVEQQQEMLVVEALGTSDGGSSSRSSSSSITGGDDGVVAVTELPPALPSPSGSTTAAAAAATAKSADADVGVDVTDPSSRVQQGSLRLMRLLLRHIAISVDSTAGGGGGGGGRSRGSGSSASSTSPRWRSPTSSSSAAASGAPGYRSPRGGGGGPAAASSSWRCQQAAPGYRARLAGSVLVTLARVGLKPGPSDLWALYRLVEAARPDLFLVSPHHLARLASSLPLLGPLRPGAVWCDHLASVARSKMYAAEVGHLAAFVWCLARLGHNPGDLWLHSLTHHLSRGGHLRAATPGQLCQILWAMHRLDFSPDPDWRADCTAAVQAALTASGPGSGTAGALTPATSAIGGSTGGVANSGPGGVGFVSPGRDCDARGLRSSDAASTSMTPSSAAVSGGGGGAGGASSLSQKGTTRGRYDRMAEQDSEEDELYDSSSSVDDLDPDVEAVMGETLAGGGRGRGGGAAAAAVVAPRRHASVYADLASLLLWSVRMGMAPGPAEMQACLERLHPTLRSLRRVHLLRLLLALSESRHRPAEGFMARLLACLQPKLPLLGATQLTQTLVALSRLGFVPSQSWLVVFLKASRTQLRHYTPSHVTATCQVFAGWQLRPSRPYLQSLLALVDALMTDFSAEGLAATLHSLSALGVKPQHRWVARALERLVTAAERNTGTTSIITTTTTTTALGTSRNTTAMLARPSHPHPHHRHDGGEGVLLTSGVLDATTAFAPGPGGPLSWGLSSSLTAPGGIPGGFRAPGVQGGYLPAAAMSPGGGAATAAAAGQQQQQAIWQQQRAATAAALVTTVCSLRGIVQFTDSGERPSRTAAATATAATDFSSTASSTVSAATDTVGDRLRNGSGSDADAVPAAATAAAADGTTPLLPYELWSSAKRLTDMCGELVDVMTGSDLAKLLTALSRINFYPGRVFLTAHARATARVGAQLAPADKEALAACYSRLTALAPRMAAEARRQAEARQARTAVVVADPWVG